MSDPREEAKIKRKRLIELDDLLLAWWAKEGMSSKEMVERFGGGLSGNYLRERATNMLRKLGFYDTKRSS